MDFKEAKDFTVMILDLTRPRNMIMAFIGVFAGAMLYTSTYQFWIIVAAAVSASMILAGGNGINDYFDHKIDEVNKPDRPIPSGRISRSDSLMVSIVFYLSGLALAKSVNDYALAIALVNTTVLIIYGKYSKKFLLLPNLTVSYLVASLFPYGMVAAVGSAALDLAQINSVMLLTACSFLLTLSREIVKDVEDLPGDKQAYSRTLPIAYGERKATHIAFMFTLVGVVLSLTPLFVSSFNLNLLAYTPLILLADIIFLLSYTMYSTLHQKLLAAGMLFALTAFLTGTLTI